MSDVQQFTANEHIIVGISCDCGGDFTVCRLGIILIDKIRV